MAFIEAVLVEYAAPAVRIIASEFILGCLFALETLDDKLRLVLAIDRYLV